MAFPSAADFQFADDADLDLSGLGISQISGDFADDLQNSFCKHSTPILAV